MQPELGVAGFFGSFGLVTFGMAPKPALADGQERLGRALVARPAQ